MEASDHIVRGIGANRGQPVGRLLMDAGKLDAADTCDALTRAWAHKQPLSDILLADALIHPKDLRDAQAQHYGVQALDLDRHKPDPACVALLPGETCLALGVVPWICIGELLVVATSRPEAFQDLDLPLDDPVIMAVATESDIHAIVGAHHGHVLAMEAERRCPSEHSCRDLNRMTPQGRVIMGIIGLLGLATLALVPGLFFGVALLLACGSLVAAQVMKSAALLANLLRPSAAEPALVLPPLQDLPRVSLLVPLFHEQNIADKLVQRLEKLTYPRHLLEVALILEDDDYLTKATLETTRLPAWCRTITVPAGTIRTKPRALNYALPFTRGDIVGIYDAEDAPAADQLYRVASHLSRAPPDVGCVQGILDFYNPHANWVSRCFTVEYASWFRVLLPGMTRLGLTIPLGGTTVFFRRSALETVGGWDAHNVTEDADLGLRLARYGYRTELLPSTTYEEANNRFWPWVRQRSRWLKGYGLTWWVHSRRPLKLWRDLGTKRFLGVQTLLLGTLAQFALAPLLWSFWLVVFDLPHPLEPVLTPAMHMLLVSLFLCSEGLSLIVGLVAVSRTRHKNLHVWVPTLFLYFPLGSLAMYKALWETVCRPFYWDKTDHGRSAPDRLTTGFANQASGG